MRLNPTQFFGGGGGGAPRMTPQLIAAGLALDAFKAVINAAATALSTFVNAIGDAVRGLAELGNVRAMMGGTGALGFLGSLGMRPGGTQAAARSLRENLSGGGFGAISAQRAGVGPVLPRQLRPGMDEGALLQKFIMNLATRADAAAIAIRANAEELLPAIALYKRHSQTVQQDAAVMDAVTKGGEGPAQDLFFQLGRIKEQFVLMVQALSKPFLQDLAAFFGRLADALRDVAIWVNNNQESIVRFKEGLKGLVVAFLEGTIAFGKGMAAFGDGLAKLPFAGGIGKQIKSMGETIAGGTQGILDLFMSPAHLQNQAANTMMGAANTMGAAIKQGTTGGGPLAQRAIRQRMPGYGIAAPGFFDRAVSGGAYRLGYF